MSPKPLPYTYRKIALAAQVEQGNFAEWLVEKGGPEALELFDGVGGVELASGCCAGGVGREVRSDAGGGGRCGVDDGHGVVQLGENALDERLEQRIVGATKDEGARVGCFGQSFGEVDTQDLGGDGMIDPTLFDQRDEERAGFFCGDKAEAIERMGVGVGLDGGSGGKYEDRAG